MPRFPAVRGADEPSKGQEAAWSDRRARSIKKATGAEAAAPAAREPTRRADGWQQPGAAMSNPGGNGSGTRASGTQPLGHAAAVGLPWWWPRDLPAPAPKRSSGGEHPPAAADSSWEQRFSTQYNRNYWVHRLTREATWRDPRPLPAAPPPLTPQQPGSPRQSHLLGAGGASAPGAFFGGRPAGSLAYTPPPVVRLAVPAGPFVAPAVISPEARQKAIQQAASPFALLAAAVRVNEGVLPPSGHGGSADASQESEAAVKIQAMQRGKQERRELQEQKEAAVKIQALQRGKQERRELQEQTEAAVKIQAVQRGKQARKVPQGGGTEEPAAGEPAAEESVAEEPAAEEPAAEESAAGDEAAEGAVPVAR